MRIRFRDVTDVECDITADALRHAIALANTKQLTTANRKKRLLDTWNRVEFSWPIKVYLFCSLRSTADCLRHAMRTNCDVSQRSNAESVFNQCNSDRKFALAVHRNSENLLRGLTL